MKMLTKNLSQGYVVALFLATGSLQIQTGFAATHRYFDVNGTTSGSGVTAGGSYSWEGSFWNNNNAAGTASTAAWPDSAGGDFARFSAGSDAAGKSYTVTANSNHTLAGSWLNANSGSVTVNGPGIFTL